jgi:hypothetical protein
MLPVTRDGSVDIATGWTARVRFPAVQDCFLFSTASRPALGLIHPPIHEVPRALSPGVKQPERETDH